MTRDCQPHFMRLENLSAKQSFAEIKVFGSAFSKSGRVWAEPGVGVIEKGVDSNTLRALFFGAEPGALFFYFKMRTFITVLMA